MIGRRGLERLAVAAPVMLGLALICLALLRPVGPLPDRTPRESPGPASPARPVSGPPAPAMLARVRLPDPPVPAYQMSDPTPSPPISRAPASPPTVRPESSETAQAAEPAEPTAPDTSPPRSASTAADGSAPGSPAIDHGTADRAMADQAAGEALLRAVEAGEGPSLTLAWPDSAADRRRIAAHLARCAGLSVALMAAGRLWRLEDPAGRFWTPDIRRVSTIVRQATGVAPGLAERIRRHHGLIGGTPVALVARRFDARLLGGLRRADAPGAPAPRQIRASYAVRKGDLLLVGIGIDRRPLAAPVVLGRIGRCD